MVAGTNDRGRRIRSNWSVIVSWLFWKSPSSASVLNIFIDAPIVPASFYSSRYEPREEINVLISPDSTTNLGDGENTRLSGFSPGIHVSKMVIHTRFSRG
jgi:hypothetical protein